MWKMEVVMVDPLGNRYEMKFSSVVPQFAHTILLMLQIHDQTYRAFTQRWVKTEVDIVTTPETPTGLRKASSASSALRRAMRLEEDDTDSIPPDSGEEET